MNTQEYEIHVYMNCLACEEEITLIVENGEVKAIIFLGNTYHDIFIPFSLWVELHKQNVGDPWEEVDMANTKNSAIKDFADLYDVYLEDKGKVEQAIDDLRETRRLQE